MIDKTTLIKVRNRDNGTVGYTIPDLGNLHRNFQVGETKEVTMEELRKLSYIPGGMYLLQNCFIIENKEAVAELLGDVEPEYSYTEEEVKLLLTSGSIDQFMDALDFAPNGVIELIKNLAVDLKLNDVAKRQAILEKTGFNVTRAIEINAETAVDMDKETSAKTRRAAPISGEEKAEEAATPSRRSAPISATGSKYKITSIKE